jgi:hypothetical protein
MSRLIDLTGKRFNMLTVLRFLEVRNKNAYWECKCDCGNLHAAAGADIKRGQIKSCGCSKSKLQASSKFKDLTGQIFGRLTVLRFVRMTEPNRVSIYECQCACGKIKEVDRASLIRKYTLSCGCYNRDKQMAAHGVASFNNYIRGYRNSASKRGYVFELTEEQFKVVIAGDCVACGAPPKEISRKTKKYSATPILANGVDRIDNKLGYIIGNVQPMCVPCNKAKSSMGYEAFQKWLEHIRTGAPKCS